MLGYLRISAISVDSDTLDEVIRLAKRHCWRVYVLVIFPMIQDDFSLF